MRSIFLICNNLLLFSFSSLGQVQNEGTLFRFHSPLGWEQAQMSPGRTTWHPGRFSIQPDNDGMLNFEPALARTFQHAIDSIQERYFTKGGISAAVHIPGKGMWLGATGLSTSEPADSISSDMLFCIGSNTKAFVSAIILQLAEEGKLTLEDSIGKFLDLSALPQIPGTITIRQLLTMRSGLFDYINTSPAAVNAIFADPDRYWTPEEILTTFVGRQRAQPGALYQYCNTNILLAGLIIQKVTNSTLGVQFRQRIFTPQTMNRTFLPAEEPLVGPIAVPWVNGVDNSPYFRDAMHSMVWAAGSIYSTAENCARWYDALFRGNIISPASKKEMVSFGSIPEAGTYIHTGIKSTGYGLCVAQYDFLGKPLWAHTGGLFAYFAFFSHHEPTGITVTLLVNSSPGDPIFEITSALYHEFFKSFPASEAIPGTVYAFGGDSGRTYMVDRSTAAAATLGRYRYGTLLNCRIRPGTNDLYGISSALGLEFVQIDGTTGEAYPRQKITFAGDIPNIKGMTFRSYDTLLLGSYDGRIFSVDLPSGVAEVIDTSGINIGGMDINPLSGELWASVRPLVSGKDRLYKISLPSCDTLRVGVTGLGKHAADIAFDPSGNLYGLIGSGNDVNQLAGIDTATGIGTVIGSLGINAVTSLVFPRTVSSVASAAVFPEHYILEQNFPNPFNPSTTIRYSLPHHARVKLSVFDLLGREIESLVDEEQSAGWKEAQWNAMNVSSGIYFYKLQALQKDGGQAGDFVKVKKLLLLK